MPCKYKKKKKKKRISVGQASALGVENYKKATKNIQKALKV